MSEIKRVNITNGSITYIAAEEPVPATTRVDGNVTINNAGQPGSPGHFETSFMISVQSEAQGKIVNNVFHWNDIVSIESDGSPYREIEDKAARNLAPMLRAVADQIDREIADYDQAKAKKKQQSEQS